jgi:hypothetical protein
MIDLKIVDVPVLWTPKDGWLLIGKVVAEGL